ncbi:MAG TPA: hypothetical protein VNB90_15105 [Cytophagaceae bacterium]|jgi:hypothetical protein|nr:hypothetical protein [Cytophagaceae bacterium]
MAKGRKKRKYVRRKTQPSLYLGAIPKEDKEVYKQLGFSLLSFAAGQALGAAVGKFSGYTGALITGAGFWKKNLYATSFGAGMALSEANGPSGFTIDSAKERTMSFLEKVGGKFMHPMTASETSTTQTSTTTNGFTGLGEATEQPKYFLNPYTQNADFSQAMRGLENIEAEIREVSGIEDEIGDLDEDRNY